jgi:hypothetical protein
MLDTAPKKTRAEVTVGTPEVELTPSRNAALTRECVFWCRSMILKLLVIVFKWGGGTRGDDTHKWNGARGGRGGGV